MAEKEHQVELVLNELGRKHSLEPPEFGFFHNYKSSTQKLFTSISCVKFNINVLLLVLACPKVK